MDLPGLRALIRPLIIALYGGERGVDLPPLCERLGLPPPATAGTKRERLTASIDALPDSGLATVAWRYLEYRSPSPALRNQIQDFLWADSPAPNVQKRYRRELARALESEALFLDSSAFDKLMEDLWILDNGDAWDQFFERNDSLRAEIKQHVHRNPGDWTVEYLFGRIGAFDASNRRFALFLEGLASSAVRPDEPGQRKFVKVVNDALAPCGAELREVDATDGYPTFALMSSQAPNMGRPKNVIFASRVKPDIRFKDAVNNDIEIVTNEKKVLVYDRPIGPDGLSWSDLQQWWSESREITDKTQAKKTLYLRLRESLPPASPPQSFLFDSFHKAFGPAIPSLPALLPEVWLHWDPMTVRERGPDALLRFRMDFLMLLPQGIRVVLEVDGKQHYAQSDGQADPRTYAAMVAGDRELKLAGYQVYRFGGAELRDEAGHEVVRRFFTGLFKRHGVVGAHK